MANSRRNVGSRNRRLGLVLTAGVAGMLGLAFASVPLYQLFCQVTGYGGTPRTEVARSELTGARGDGQMIRVMFDANVNKRLEWQFDAPSGERAVEPGVESLAVYTAKNIGDRPIVGTATFNVTPVKAAQYVAKMECFCFTEQKLEAGQEMPMPVSFFIDPAILDDPNTQDVHDIVLSYTFHPSVEATAALDAERETGGS
ncbi:MAG: cytochrome c oxidase assembly protein [Rhodospirillales bacterium]